MLFSIVFREWDYASVALVQSFLVFAVGYRYGSILAQAWYLFSGVKLYAKAHTSGVPHLVALELASHLLFDIKIFLLTFLLFLLLFLVVLHTHSLQHRTHGPSLQHQVQIMTKALRESEIALRRLHEENEQVLLLLSHRLFKTEEAGHVYL